MKSITPLLVVASIAGLCQSASAQANYQVTVTGTVATNTGNFADARYNPIAPGTPFSFSYELARNPINGTSSSFTYALGQGPVTLTMGTTTIASPTPVETAFSNFVSGFGVGSLPNVGSDVVLQNSVQVGYAITGLAGTLFTNQNLNINGSFSGSSFFSEAFNINENGSLAMIEATVLSIEVLVPNLIGTGYCSVRANSTGQFGQLITTGSDVAADNDVLLNVDRLPPLSFGLGLVSNMSGFIDFSTIPGSSNVGILCLGGSIGRYSPPFQTNLLGQAVLPLDLTNTPPFSLAIVAGQTWYFQAWHRDSSPTGPISNYTNPISVNFN